MENENRGLASPLTSAFHTKGRGRSREKQGKPYDMRIPRAKKTLAPSKTSMRRGFMQASLPWPAGLSLAMARHVRDKFSYIYESSQGFIPIQKVE